MLGALIKKFVSSHSFLVFLNQHQLMDDQVVEFFGKGFLYPGPLHSFVWLNIYVCIYVFLEREQISLFIYMCIYIIKFYSKNEMKTRLEIRDGL